MKIKIAIIFILMLQSALLVAQQNDDNNNLEVSKDENKSNYYRAYFTEIKLNSNLAFRQEMNTRTGSDYTVFEFPLLLKYNITKKVSLLMGPKIDLYTDGKGVMNSPSVYGTFGVQYDASENLLFEAMFNYRLTDDMPIQTDYTFGSKSAFKLGSKFRF
ncbi:hypothetical protein ACFSKN_16815 [Mariniflexile gromovii]|uniref:Outer membrane protein with beta-barrel domain n=1 Tax=Mariniflexile gromovii TaxID=362523 RepID=A0ABS4BYA2_9FLAO|nr:hypothetical protein [Mariniflexile gromovii]MBP0905564.1 hypothetical protein [Mariniflexile gromovii]